MDNFYFFRLIVQVSESEKKKLRKAIFSKHSKNLFRLYEKKFDGRPPKKIKCEIFAGFGRLPRKATAFSVPRRRLPLSCGRSRSRKRSRSSSFVVVVGGKEEQANLIFSNLFSCFGGLNLVE